MAQEQKTMRWVKKGSCQVAQGKIGRFVIEKSWGGMYRAYYFSDYQTFTLPPKKSIKDLKAMCEKNHHWED